MPDEDTLFNLLNALHSFNDKLRKATRHDLFGSINFQALKALRNLLHHESELMNRVKVVRVDSSTPLESDLMALCLIHRQTVLDALDRDLENTKQRQRRDGILGAFKWCGPIANINPCVFNCAAEVFEAVRQTDITPTCPEFREFEASYQFEEEHGYPHRVTGDIRCLAGDASETVRQLFETE